MKIYIMGEDAIIEANEGTGDNLLDEDIEAGYVDYIYYTIYDIEDLDAVTEKDGGMILLKEPFRDEFCKELTYTDGSKHYIVDDEKLAKRVVDFAYGEDTEYIIL